MASPDPDPWADLADDIRRGRAAEAAEVWQARATKAEARVAELEEAIANALQCLRQDFAHAAADRLRKAAATDHA